MLSFRRCRTFLLYGFLFLAALQGAYAQSNPTAAPDAQIRKIRAEYEQINKSTLTRKAVRWSSPDSCQPAYMEGTVTYFYKNAQLVKIYSEGGEDHGEWKEEFYFRDGKLFFVYQNNAYGGAANPVEVKYQNRYYFDEGKLIWKIQSKGAPDTEVAQLMKLAARLAATTGKAEVSRIMGCGD